jgi:hypothetical protein
MYFRARNGTFKRVPQKGNVNFEASNGGMTVYYTPVISGSGKVTAFKPVCIPLLSTGRALLQPPIVRVP